MKEKLLAIFVAWVVGISAAFAQQDIVTFTTSGSVVNDDASYTLGYEFSVASPITVTGLSAFTAIPAAGLNENTPVGLWDASGNLLASTTVLSGTADPLTVDGLFRYATLATPMTLSDGTYYVGAEVEATEDSLALNVNDLSTIPGVTFDQNAFNEGSSLAFPDSTELALQNGFFGGNVVAAPSAVPEPKPIVLSTIGLAALAVFGCKQRRRGGLHASLRFRLGRALVVLVLAGCLTRTMGLPVPTATMVAGSKYHAQIAGYSCTVACMEMQLDCNEVRQNNMFVNAMLGLANPDGNVFEPPSNPRLVLNPPFGWVPNPNFVQLPGPTYNPAGNVTANVQTYLYGLVHGQYTYPTRQAVNPPVNCYNNPRYGFGTDFLGADTGMNLLDDSVHSYEAYVFPNAGATAANPAQLIDGDQASRTIANALSDFKIPAIIAILGGQHAISVNGVLTDVAPGFNQKYTIDGFFVSDSFFGYHAHFPRTTAPSAWKDAGYVRYGWDLPKTGGTLKLLPDGTTKRIRLLGWFQKFNPTAAPDPGVAGAIGMRGYKIEVDPEGPEPADDGNGGLYVSVPAPPEELPVELDAAGALVYATNDLAANPYLSIQPGWSNGTFDVANAFLLQLPSDGSQDGDWLLPFEGSGGTNDVTAYVLIDAATGMLDEAGWADPANPSESMTLSDLIEMETNSFAGNGPDDNAPSPSLDVQSTVSDNLVLSWPAVTPGTYYLEQNSDLSTTNWVLVTNPPVVVSNQNQVVISGPQTGNIFYQLIASPGL